MPAMLIDDADCLDGATLQALSTLATLRGGERRLLSAVLTGTPELVGRGGAARVERPAAARSSDRPGADGAHRCGADDPPPPAPGRAAGGRDD
ncbi:MAG: hypothetical protein U1E38_00965 [Rhodospirillales bacterium]